MKKSILFIIVWLCCAGSMVAQLEEHRQEVTHVCQGVKIEKAYNKVYFSEIQTFVKQIGIAKIQTAMATESEEMVIYNSFAQQSTATQTSNTYESEELSIGEYKIIIAYKNSAKKCTKKLEIDPSPNPGILAECDLTCVTEIFQNAPDPTFFFPSSLKELQTWEWSRVFNDIYPIVDDPQGNNYWTNSDPFSKGLKIDVENTNLVNIAPEDMLSIAQGSEELTFSLVADPTQDTNTPAALPFRSEIVVPQVLAVGAEQWVGWSFNFPDSYFNDPNEITIFQIQQGQHFVPQVSLGISGSNSSDVDARGNFILKTHTGEDTPNLYKDTKVLVKKNSTVNFIAHIVYDTDPTKGVLELWIDDVKVYPHEDENNPQNNDPLNLATAHCNAPFAGKLKFGLYHFSWNPSGSLNDALENMDASIVASNVIAPELAVHEMSMGPLRIITQKPGDLYYSSTYPIHLVNPHTCEQTNPDFVPCIGSPCDDNNPLTENDAIIFNGVCRGTRTYEGQISSVENIAIEDLSGSFSTGSQIMDLGEDFLGLRFTNIPDFSLNENGEARTKIVSAYIQFTSAAIVEQIDPLQLSIAVALPDENENDINNGPFTNGNRVSTRNLGPGAKKHIIHDSWICTSPGGVNGNVANMCDPNLVPPLQTSNCNGQNGPLQRLPGLKNILNNLIRDNLFQPHSPNQTAEQSDMVFVIKRAGSTMGKRSFFGINELNNLIRGEDAPKLVIKYISTEDPLVFPKITKAPIVAEAPFNFTIHPNPFQENFQLTFPNLIEERIQINIFNAAGQRVNSFNIQNKNSHQVDTQNYATGMYFVQVKKGDQVYTKKLIKL